jgi:hypothetical protein
MKGGSSVVHPKFHIPTTLKHQKFMATHMSKTESVHWIGRESSRLGLKEGFMSSIRVDFLPYFLE